MVPLSHRLARALAYAIALAALGACAWSVWAWQPQVWAQQRRERAAALSAAHDNLSARATLRELLRRLPRDREARWQLVQLEMQDRRFEQAYLEAKAYTELFPDASEAWLLIAQLMNTGGLPDEAEAAADNAVESAPDKLDPRAARATLRLRRDRWFGAREDAQWVLSRDPRYVTLWAVRAQAAGAIDGPQACVASIREGLAATKGAPLLRVALARCLAQAGHPAQARDILERAAQEPASKAPALALLARIDAREGRFGAASDALATVLQDQPINAELVSARALLQAVDGHVDAALQGIDSALPYAPALGNVRELIARHREHPAQLRNAIDAWSASAVAPARAQPTPAGRVHRGARRERGELVETHAMVWPGTLAELRRDADRAAQAKDWAGADEVALRARVLYPGSVIGPWIAGVSALAQERYDVAERELSSALAVAPRSALVVKGLAQVWVKQASAITAGDKLMQLASADPGFAFARRHAANQYLAARRPDLAEAALRAGLADPGDAGAYLDLTSFFRDVDRAGEALTIVEQGLAKYPADVELRSLAARLAARGDAKDAIARLEALVKDAPDRTGDAIALAGLLLGQDGGKPRALALLRNAEADAPIEFDDVEALGWNLARAGETARATAWLESASQAAPDDLGARYRLAAAYAQAGRRADAIAHLDFALKSGRPFAEQPEAQKLRQSLGS